MTDLNSIMFYKAKFTISCVDETCDLLWKIVLHIRRWQTEKWNRDGIILDTNLPTWSRLKTGNRIFSKDKNNTVYIESEYFKPDISEEYWACKIVEQRLPKQGYCLRQWITEVGFEKASDSESTFSCVLSYSDVPGFIGPCESTPVPTLPKLIRMLIEDDTIKCSVGIDNITTRPWHLTAGDYPQFWKRLIDPKRELPYIYISPQIEEDPIHKMFSQIIISPQIEKNPTGNGTLVINPDDLAEAVCANAIVLYSDSLPFTWEMNYLCKENYSCNSGRIRIYMPKIDTENTGDQYRHRYLTPTYITEVGPDAVIQMFRKALAQNVNFYESFFRIEGCRRMKEDVARKKRLAEIRALHKREISNLTDQKLEEAIEEEQKCLEAESIARVIQDELSCKKSENHRLVDQIESMRAAANRCSDLEKSISGRLQITRYPNRPSDIVNYFSCLFGDKIAFSKDAQKSLKDCEISGEDLWEILFDLATVMQKLFAEHNPDPYNEFKKQTGIDCARGEGSMTRKDKKLMVQFETEFDGRLIDIEPHITFSREGQSIHFGFDDTAQKIIIGHCGKHLNIYSTPKRSR